MREAAHEVQPSAIRLDDLLLDAKLSIPQPRPGTVARPALVDSVRASRCRVVAVTAPSGYGKTTFLAQWAETETRRVACVTLDRFDDDPASVLTLLAAAVARVAPGYDDLVAEMQSAGISVLGRAAPRLAAAIRGCPTPFVLMLDDLHEIRSPACHDALEPAIAAVPEHSQLVAASRSSQPHVARLRTSDEVVEVVASDLALDANGAAHIFASAAAPISTDLAAEVTRRTEGWPVGLHLAALIAKESPGEALAVSGDDRYFADYLYRESLMQLPEGVQQFLRRTAVLDQLSGPLCDALVEGRGSAEQLRALETANLFLVPLDRRREWFRYHALFREFLLVELRRVEPDTIPKLHLRAADWYEAAGSAPLAVEHLLCTPERGRTVELVSKLVLLLYMGGKVAVVQRWLATLGDAAIMAYPPLAVLAGWIAVVTGEANDAQRWAAAVEAASFDLVPVDGTASFASARAMLRAVMCATGPEEMLENAQFAITQEPRWAPWHDKALSLCAEAHLLLGDVDHASSYFAEASRVAAENSGSDSLDNDSELGLLAIEDGRWEDAAVHVEHVVAFIDARRMDDYALSVLAFVCASRLALHRGDEAEAHRQLTRAMRTRGSLTFALPWFAVRVRLQLAKVHATIGDRVTARHLVREIDDIMLHRPALGTLADEVVAFRTDLESSPHVGIGGGPPLSPAELRLLPYLQTHLTFPEIAERLFVSHNTVRSQVGSIYRKLGVSCRNDAVQHATAVGLLGG